MHGVYPVHLAGIHPRLEYGCAATEPFAVVGTEVLGQAGAAADHFHGENTRCLGVAPRELHLGANVLAQCLAWIVVNAQGVEGAVPQLDDVAQHGDVQAELVGEVIVQVGLGQVGLERDGVHARAFIAVAGELVLGGLDDGLFVLLADAAGGLARIGEAMRRDF